MSLIDQFEVQFNELSNFALSDGSLTEVQPVEIAGVVNQEINRIEKQLTDYETLDSLNIFLSNHDHKRLSMFYPLIEQCEPNEIKCIQRILVNYNDVNPLNDYKIKATAVLQKFTRRHKKISQHKTSQSKTTLIKTKNKILILFSIC